MLSEERSVQYCRHVVVFDPLINEPGSHGVHHNDCVVAAVGNDVDHFALVSVVELGPVLAFAGKCVQENDADVGLSGAS